MHSNGLAETSYPAHFDIHDAAGPKLSRHLRVASVMNAFIEANSGLDQFLQACVKINVVVPQWLFDH